MTVPGVGDDSTRDHAENELEGLEGPIIQGLAEATASRRSNATSTLRWST